MESTTWRSRPVKAPMLTERDEPARLLSAAVSKDAIGPLDLPDKPDNPVDIVIADAGPRGHVAKIPVMLADTLPGR